eukprot:403360669
MGNIFQPSTQEKNILLLGLERAGKTHMLYNYLVGEGGMHTIKKLKETLGMNYEHIVESPQNFDVWDISGNPLLRKQWTLYISNIPVAGIIYVVNISEDIERIREGKKQLHKLMSEPALSDSILAVVFNVKPNISINNGNSAGQMANNQEEEKKRGEDQQNYNNGNNQQSSTPLKPLARKKDQWVESPFNQEQLEKIFELSKLKRTMIKQSFYIDIGEQKACEKVFQWMSGKLDYKLRVKAKRERKLVQEQQQPPQNEEDDK